MLRLQAFRVEEKEHGNASLQAGSTTALSSIKDFGAKTYTEDEEKALSEIIDNFNQRHGTEFTKEDFLRFEQVNREILGDEDLREMLKNNPPDVVFGAFSHAFFEGAIKLFQKDKQLQNIVMSDAQAREQATRHFFSRALREVQSEQR
jgi:type I restriction enzyme R subunit